MVTAASIAMLLFTVGGAEEPAMSPSFDGGLRTSNIDRPAGCLVSLGSPSWSRGAAGAGRLRGPAGWSRRPAGTPPDSVVVVLRAEQTALTVGRLTDRPKTPSVAASRLRPVRVARIIAWAAAVTAATAAGMARLASADEAAPKPEPVVPSTSVTAPLVPAAPFPRRRRPGW